MHQEQALSVPSGIRVPRSATRITRRLAFAALPVAIDADTLPADVLHDLHEVDRFAQMQRFHAAFDLTFLNSVVLCTVTLGASDLSAVVGIGQRSSHHAEHLRPGHERIVPLHFVRDVVGQELKTSSLRIEHLATAGDEARPVDSVGRGA